MFRILAHGGERNLVRAECALDRHAIHFFRARPALRSAQDDHRPRWRAADLDLCAGLLSGKFSECPGCARSSDRVRRREVGARFRDRLLRRIQGCSQALCRTRSSSSSLVRACDRRAGDFVAIQMQNRQHRSVSRWIQELDALPASFERAGLSLAIADDASHDQIRIIERRSKGVDQRIAKFASLMHGVRRVRSAMARNTAGRRKRTKEKPHTVDVLGNFRMHFGISSFEVCAGVQGRPSVAGARNVNDICIRFPDQPVQMNVDEILPGRCAPMPQQARLDVFFCERLAQQRIIEEIDLADAEIIRGAPIAIASCSTARPRAARSVSHLRAVFRRALIFR